MKLPNLFKPFGLIVLALLFVAGMTLSSCGNTTSTKEADPENTQEAPAEQPATNHEHPAGHDHEHPAE